MSRKPGGPRWETPDPPGVKGTYGGAVERWALRELGIRYGRWQSHVIRRALRHDRDGNLIHRIVLLSTGRQNGKSVIVRGLFGWVLDEGRELPAFDSWTTLLAAAHDAKQARIIYGGVYDDLRGIPRLLAQSTGARHGKHVKLTEHFGVQVGKLRMDTVTSQPGSSRGLSAGAIAWDEVNTQQDWDMWEALSPTQSAQRNPIMLLTSTAGFDDSVVLRAFYDRLVRIASGDEKPDPAFYGAWWQSDDPYAGLDWRQIKQANPALNDGRLTRAAIATEYGILPQSSWQRERLNHFVDTVADSAFPPGAWAKLRAPGPLVGADGPYYLGVDIRPGWERATICVAGLRADGRIGAEVYRDLRSSDEPITAQSLIAAIKSFPDPVAAVVFDQVTGPAAEFARFGELDWGVEWRALKPNQVVASCMDLTELVLSGRLAVDDPLLDVQIPFTARRNVGQDGAFRWSRADSRGPIDAVFAMTFAVTAVANAAPPPRIS